MQWLQYLQSVVRWLTMQNGNNAWPKVFLAVGFIISLRFVRLFLCVLENADFVLTAVSYWLSSHGQGEISVKMTWRKGHLY